MVTHVDSCVYIILIFSCIVITLPEQFTGFDDGQQDQNDGYGQFHGFNIAFGMAPPINSYSTDSKSGYVPSDGFDASSQDNEDRNAAIDAFFQPISDRIEEIIKNAKNIAENLSKLCDFLKSPN